jgi:hypothetical protein
MAVWSGFETELLQAANVSTATMTVQFMDDWNYAASSDCENNPVDISHVLGTRRNCHKLTASRTAQNYTTHTHAATAFSDQLHSGNFPHLLAALKTSNPYNYSDPAGVVADLKTWGSPKQAAYYQKFATGGSGGGGPGGGSGSAPHAHTGWADLQRSVNQKLPAAMNRADKDARDALRSLAKAHKVRV